MSAKAIQISVKKFLPGFGKGWLTYCITMHFLLRAVQNVEGDSRNLADMFLPNSVQETYDPFGPWGNGNCSSWINAILVTFVESS